MTQHITQNDLVGKDKKELREIAASLNIQTVDGRTSEDNLIKEILRHVQPKHVLKDGDTEPHASQKTVTPAKIYTEEEVKKIIKPFTDKGMEAKFKDDTWHFRYKGREDSGHMSTELRVIRMKAENVSRGALRPKGFQDGADTSQQGKANSNFVLWG